MHILTVGKKSIHDAKFTLPMGSNNNILYVSSLSMNFSGMRKSQRVPPSETTSWLPVCVLFQTGTKTNKASVFAIELYRVFG